MTEPIIGIGTARGGTTSLARLLQAWGLRVCHEGKPPDGPFKRVIPSQCWRVDDPRRASQYRQAVQGFQRDGIDGDVACWHVQVIDDLLEDFPEAQVIGLIRDRAATVESLNSHFRTYRIRTNRYWGGSTFPTIPDTVPAHEAWGRYVDTVHEKIRGLASAKPWQVALVRTELLESRAEQERIAWFLGVEDWHHVPDCHHNRRDPEKTPV